MANQPGQAILSIFDQIIERIKSTRPVGTDNKPIERGFVYSQLVLGQMVDPDDFANPWSPAGGSTVHDALNQGSLPANAGAAVQTGAAPAATAPDAAQAAAAASAATSAKIRRALQAAFNTSQLVDRLLMVTKDERMQLYPGNGRTISFAYDSIVNGMQPLPAPPMSPEVQARVDAARKVLFEFDEDGEIAGKSKLYKRYVKNARAYAEAKGTFADAQADAMKDPAKAEIWPMKSVTLQNAVDEAYDTLKTEGAEKVEKALGVIESIGLSVQDRMIAKARKLLDVWSLGLAGVPTQTPYSSVLPSGWADPEETDSGWTTLTVNSSQYASHTAQNSHFFQQSSDHHDSSSTSVSASGSYFGFGGGGGFNTSSQNTSSQGSVEAGSACRFSNTAENLEISLEYGLCDVVRPWLVGDLFYMKNWYMVNNPANAISDGTFEHQVDGETSLMPMIPTQFLVIRNVKISSSKWGSDAQTLTHFFGKRNSESSLSETDYNASARAGFGPIAFRADASHAESEANASQSSSMGASSRSDYEAYFDGSTLHIRGAQVIAWLSSIVPACPPMDDPGLKKAGTTAPAAAAGATATAAPAPATAPATAPV